MKLKNLFKSEREKLIDLLENNDPVAKQNLADLKSCRKAEEKIKAAKMENRIVAVPDSALVDSQAFADFISTLHGDIVVEFKNYSNMITARTFTDSKGQPFFFQSETGELLCGYSWITTLHWD